MNAPRALPATALIFALLSWIPVSAQDQGVALLEAAMRGDAEQVRSLIAAGAKADGPERGKRTPLAYAAAQGSTDTVQALLDAGASPDARDEEGVSPLMMAAGEGHTAI